MRSFDDFTKAMHLCLSGHAASKGYGVGPDDPNPLFQLTGRDHAIGEIIYKAVRYRSRLDPDDLVKIAAWAFLCWKSDV